MVAAYYRHEFKQGDDYSVDVDLRDSNGAIDTAGWQGSSGMQTLDGETPVDANGNPIAFSVTFPVSGTVRFKLPAVLNKQLMPRRYLHDAKLLDASGIAAYYLSGDVIVRRSYTP